ncbi:MAG: DUF115 domain-containing protein [Treponema sp.]|nr:DUF115 domain-containing protein [Treponema sp.]
MSFWNKNKEILQKQYAGLFEELTKKDDDDFLPEDIKIDTAHTGQPTLSVKGISVHSQRDPEREGKRLADSVCAETVNTERGAIVVLGFGLGYAALEAVKLGCSVIIVEKHKSLLLKAFELIDFSEFLSKNRIMFIVGDSGESITDALAIASSMMSKNMTEKKQGSKQKPFIIRNKALTCLDEGWYRFVEKKIHAWAMKDQVNAATQKKFGHRWTRNIMCNLNAIRDYPGVSRLAILAETPFPVFLAAAGPGLDKIKPLLREIHERCIIVAVDTSLRFFVQNGIQPDFVVVVDPQFWNNRHLDRCVNEHISLKTILVAESAVYPSVLNLPFKNKFLCGSMFALGTWVENKVDIKGRLGAGGSVATTAWDFARMIGCGQIWISGLDLAYPGYKTHFRGARFEALANSQANRFNPAEKWVTHALRDGVPFKTTSASGGEVLTDKRLSLYSAWFENQFRQYAHAPGQIENLAFFQDGMAITGLKSADIKNFLELPKRREKIDQCINAALSKIENEFNNHETKQKREQTFESSVSFLNNTLENIRHNAAKGAEIAQNAISGSLNLNQQEKIFRELDVILKCVTENEVKDIIAFLFPAQEDNNLTPEKREDNSFEAWLKNNLELFTGVSQALTSLISKKN